jgi:hypothetical protein
MARLDTRQTPDSPARAGRHPDAMNTEPRTQGADEAARNAAYRRLAAVILRLDVPTLARDLRAIRLEADQSGEFARAA